jgi:predicted RNA-binding protein YlxR (DUF448 family)
MKRVAERTCVGCLKKKPKSQLVRLIAQKGKTIIDPTGRAPGRGIYVCQGARGMKKSCLVLAKEKNAFKKVFKEKIHQNTHSGRFRSH